MKVRAQLTCHLGRDQLRRKEKVEFVVGREGGHGSKKQGVWVAELCGVEKGGKRCASGVVDCRLGACRKWLFIWYTATGVIIELADGSLPHPHHKRSATDPESSRIKSK